MATSPASFWDIGKRAKDLLTRDYNFDHKYTLSLEEIPYGQRVLVQKQSSSFVRARWKGLIATGLKRDQIFVGDINTLYKSGKTTVDVKVDTYSNVSTKVILSDILPSTKAAFSFKIPDHKSGKLDVQYIHPYAAIDSSIGLNPTPLLELSVAIGSKDLSLGAEVGFDTASANFTKYNAGIGMNKPDYSAPVLLTDKGQLTVVKTRFSDNGKVAMLCQHEWRPKSLLTLSAEYDSKASNASPKLGLALSLKP
nr:mitochondrial outer membrane protein porin 4 [Quercus suber]